MAPWAPEPDLRQATPDRLPNPELTPTANPVLARNLGRWAQVYFTSPPQKREQAVAELVRELQDQSAENDPLPKSQQRRQETKLLPEVLCPRCQHQNVRGSEFCVFCGSPLQSSDARSLAGAPNMQPENQQSTANSDPELDRLRSLSLRSEPAPKNGSYRRVKFALVGCSLLIAATFYLVLTRRHVMEPTPSSQTPAPSNPVAPPVTEPSRKPPETSLSSAGAANANDAMPMGKKSSAPAVPPAASQTVSATNSSKEAVGGSQELKVAQRYLAGNQEPRDPAEAAKWLWKAVGKQNPAASVLLADLYAKGDGVAKNCEQARLLLTAAVQRHARGAEERLQSLQSGECP